MPATFVPAPRVCRFTLGFSAEGSAELWHVVLELGKVSEWADGGGAMADDAAAIAAWVDTDLLPLLSSNVAIVSITGQRMLAYGEPIYDFSPGSWPDSGEVASVSLPMNACIVQQKNTGATGRSRRGRSYWSGIPESKQDGPNRISSAHQTSFSDAGADLLSGIAFLDNGSQLAVVSRYHKVGSTPSVPRDEAIFNFVTEYSVPSTEIRTRRKRMERV